MSEEEFKSKFRSSSEVLQALFENGKSPISGQFLRWKLWARWKEVVGATIAEHSEPVSYVNGNLYVWVKSSSWIQHLIFLKKQLQDVINQKMEQNFVKNIHFTLDRRGVPQGSDEQDQIKSFISKVASPEKDDR